MPILDKPSQELIPVHHSMVGTDLVPTVLATELHAFLGVKRDFSNWLKGRISKYEFQENQDFISFRQNGRKPLGGRPSIEYHLTLDMAKELSMVENNAKGRKARRYFIQRDKDLTAVQQPEQPQLTYATKEERKPLVKAIRGLVAKCQNRGKQVSYSEMHQVVNLQMGVDSIDEMTVDQLKEARNVVGKILKEVIFEGVHESKDDKQVFNEEPTPVYSTITSGQLVELKQKINAVTQRLTFNGNAYVYDVIRKKYNLEQIADLPVEFVALVMDWVESLEQEYFHPFNSFVHEWHLVLFKDVICEGIPMTSQLKKQWKKKFGKEVGKNPDWMAVYNDLEVA